MAVPELSATTVSYLFASEWAPEAGAGWGMHVPGAKVDGPGTAANLLNLALWALREDGLLELELLRPPEPERVMVMGGRSFSKVRALPGEATVRPGLEGALLRAARAQPGQGALDRLHERLADALSAGEEGGTRTLVHALDLQDRSPWWSVALYCIGEAQRAGILELRGRLVRKPVIVDKAALAALAPRDAEIVAARRAHRERAGELDDAVCADCLAALRWAHQS